LCSTLAMKQESSPCAYSLVGGVWTFRVQARLDAIGFERFFSAKARSPAGALAGDRGDQSRYAAGAAAVGATDDAAGIAALEWFAAKGMKLADAAGKTCLAPKLTGA
jgi:hypothetical protein